MNLKFQAVTFSRRTTPVRPNGRLLASRDLPRQGLTRTAPAIQLRREAFPRIRLAFFHLTPERPIQPALPPGPELVPVRKHLELHGSLKPTRTGPGPITSRRPPR